jgi:hypothetical protein
MGGMSPSKIRQREHLLQQMRQIEAMERGTVAEEYRVRVVDGGETKAGPYFKYQEWKDGRNQSRRVSAEEAATLRAGIAGRQQFEELAAEFIDLTVTATRAEAATPESKKNGRRPSTRRSSPRRRPS